VIVAGMALLHPAPVRADPIVDLQRRYQLAVGQAQQALRDWTIKRREQQTVVETLRGVSDSYAGELRRVDQELLAAVARVRQAEADLERVGAEVQALDVQIAAKQAATDERAAAYATRLRGLYKFTRISPLEQLLAARDFSDAMRRIMMMQAVARVDNRLLSQLRTEQAELQRSQAELKLKQAEAVKLRDDLEVGRQALAEKRAEQAHLVARAQREQASAEAALTDYDREQRAQAAQVVALQAQYQQELVELERQRQEELRRQEEQRRLEQERRLAAVATATAQAATAAAAESRSEPTAIAGQGTGAARSGTVSSASTPAAYGALAGAVQTAALQPSSSGFIWPVGNPVVTTEFGERTFAQSSHTGIDLAQNQHTPVLAAADGIVLKRGLAVPGKPEQSYGMMVVVGHSQTLSTLYAHLDDKQQPPPVKDGERVKRGQVIGYIGVTGITSGPHLHFEVLASGDVKNPRLYLPKGG
jgi:murein DD-endopeptidase MepM/ murein hydrolase activator NlpD